MTAVDCHLHYASWQAYLHLECMNTFVFQPMQAQNTTMGGITNCSPKTNYEHFSF